jgi:hypothetical protein
MYSSIKDSEAALVFEHDTAALKKLSSFVRTDKCLICFPKCHPCVYLKYVLNCEQHFSFLIFQYGLSCIIARITCMVCWDVRPSSMVEILALRKVSIVLRNVAMWATCWM